MAHKTPGPAGPRAQENSLSLRTPKAQLNEPTVAKAPVPGKTRGPRALGRIRGLLAGVCKTPGFALKVPNNFSRSRAWRECRFLLTPAAKNNSAAPFCAIETNWVLWH